MKTETTTTKSVFDLEASAREGSSLPYLYEALASMKNRKRLHLYDVIMRYAPLRRGTDGSQRGADANLHTDPSLAGCQRTETASKVQKKAIKRITTKNVNFHKTEDENDNLRILNDMYNMNRSFKKIILT